MPPILGVLFTITVALPNNTLFSEPPCTSNSECPSDKCCVLESARHAMPTCKPFQQRSQECQVNADTITTNLTCSDNSQIEVKGVHHNLCPCADGLSCNSSSSICE